MPVELPIIVKIPWLFAVVVTFPVKSEYKFAVPVLLNTIFELVVPVIVLKLPVPVVIVVVVAIKLSWKVVVPAFTFTFVATTSFWKVVDPVPVFVTFTA